MVAPRTIAPGPPALSSGRSTLAPCVHIGIGQLLLVTRFGAGPLVDLRGTRLCRCLSHRTDHSVDAIHAIDARQGVIKAQIHPTVSLCQRTHVGRLR